MSNYEADEAALWRKQADEDYESERERYNAQLDERDIEDEVQPSAIDIARKFLPLGPEPF